MARKVDSTGVADDVDQDGYRGGLTSEGGLIKGFGRYCSTTGDVPRSFGVSVRTAGGCRRLGRSAGKLVPEGEKGFYYSSDGMERSEETCWSVWVAFIRVWMRRTE